MLPTLLCVVVGLGWGLTNPYIRKGSVVVKRKKGVGQGWRAEWGAFLTTPSFLIPQVLNLICSILFIALLGSGANVSVAVPAANATSLAANAVVDLLLGESNTELLAIARGLKIHLGHNYELLR